jgi:hypothetical protein
LTDCHFKKSKRLYFENKKVRTKAYVAACHPFDAAIALSRICYEKIMAHSFFLLVNVGKPFENEIS